jgi:hypothetical protein
MPPQSSTSSRGGGGLGASGFGNNNTSNKNVPKTGKVSSTSKPPPIEKLAIPAIVLAIALLAYQFLKGINAEVSFKFLFFIVFDFVHTFLTFLSLFSISFYISLLILD